MAKQARYVNDEMGAHARLYESIGRSPAWLALGFSARALYMELRLKLKQTNNGNIDATLAVLKHAGFKSSSTLAKGLRELETVGLIDKTRQGGIANGGKVCNLYRFTDKPTLEMKKIGIVPTRATHEWKCWGSVCAAKAAIRDAHHKARRVKPEKNVAKLRRSKRTDSNCELEEENCASNSGHDQASPVRSSKLLLIK